MIRKFLYTTSAVFFVLFFSSCYLKREDEIFESGIKIAILKDASFFSAIGLKKANDETRTKNRYDIVLSSSYAEIMASVASKKIDITFLPVSLACVLYNKTGGNIKIISLNTLNNIYLITNNKNYTLPKGGTVYILNNELHLKSVVNLLFKGFGIENLSFRVLDNKENFENEAEKAVIASQPYCEGIVDQYKFGDVLTINLGTMWEKLSGGIPVPTSCIVVRKDFLKQHDKKFKNFVEDYEKNFNYANRNLKESINSSKNIFNFSEKTLKRSIPKCNLVNITGNVMKKIVDNFLKKIGEMDLGLIGGKIPDETLILKS